MPLKRLPDIFPADLDFDELAREAMEADIPWTRHYSEYQSGGWWTCSLLGRSADATDGRVTDTIKPTETDALERLPATARLLQEIGLRYMLARLARLDPKSALWEHRDYQDLPVMQRQRIHLPLETNPDAFLVSDGCRFHMSPGSFWTFRPTTAHGACNLGSQPRVHLLLDVYEDDRLRELLRQATAPGSIPLPAISSSDLTRRIGDLRAAFDGSASTTDNETGSLMPWERAALELYFSHAIPEGQIYRELEIIWRAEGDASRASFWANRRQLVLSKGVHA